MSHEARFQIYRGDGQERPEPGYSERQLPLPFLRRCVFRQLPLWQALLKDRDDRRRLQEAT